MQWIIFNMFIILPGSEIKFMPGPIDLGFPFGNMFHHQIKWIYIIPVVILWRHSNITTKVLVLDFFKLFSIKHIISSMKTQYEILFKALKDNTNHEVLHELCLLL